MITVVHGPQASGKTRRAEALKAHFGCDNIVDGWTISDLVAGWVLRPNSLVLTTEHPEAIRGALPHARLVAIEDAKVALEQAAMQAGIPAIPLAINAPDATGYVYCGHDEAGERIATYLHAGVRIAYARPKWAGGSILIDMLGGLRPAEGYEEEGITLLLTPGACRQIGQDLIAIADAEAPAAAKAPHQRPTLKLAHARNGI
ncbi:hypothetical protein [Sphingomonas sp. KC8]|uniref:hypothetical protein n=1 Tax=Sphingomonas sp. KC8 TaxID=1030157 RepID=UPI0002489394|nr:hypothetical protein [Sphingomonas sp. KC8]ARS29051.1 hypothetical protein KC8_17415 [Sphingomonas sp. KC8]